MNDTIEAPGPRIVAFEDGDRHIGIAAGRTISRIDAWTTSDIGDVISMSSEELERLAADSQDTVDLADVRLLPPVDRRARIFCLALNYREHADESGGADPGRPVIFHKLDSSLIGPFDDIQTPAYTDFLDYEAELGVVVGTTGRDVPSARWHELIGGYTVINDVSCRDMQATKLGDQVIVDWFSAKEADMTTPVGPWIVPADEVKDPQALSVSLIRNGETLQDASTSLMIFDIPRIVEYLSSRVTLRPGDLIATGTPGGVGKARGIRLLPGDVIRTEVSSVGLLTNRVAAARE